MQDVALVSLTDKQVLAYNETTQKIENMNIIDILGFTPEDSANK